MSITRAFRLSLAFNILVILLSILFFIKYKDRVLAKFASQPKKEINIVMYGDSRVEMGDWTTGLKRNDVKNSGISGATTINLYDSLESKVIAHHPKICFIEAGINDIRSQVKLDTTLIMFSKMIDRLKENNVKVIINSVIPVSKDPFQYEVPDDTINSKVEELNYKLKNICKNKGVEYLDINHDLAENNKFKLKYTLDGVHVHPNGFIVWFNYIKSCLAKYKL